MRRGLIGWDATEVPAATLDARLARFQEGMKKDGLDAALIYTNFPRPAAVSYLTHFVPYWSQSLLVVMPEDAPVLVSANTKRVAGWMEETSHLGRVECTGDIAGGTAKLLSAAKAKRVGIVEKDKLPGGIGVPLQEKLAGARFEDATALFARIRHPADEAEIALSRRAKDIAADALAAALAERPREAGMLIGAIEGAAREAGAEEVIINVAPDLARDTRLARLEGETPLGERYAVRVSVAYKGHWIRITSTNGQDEERFARAIAGLAAGATAPKGCVAEITIGSAPLTPVARLVPGSVATLSFAFEGPILSGAPVLVPMSGRVERLS
jgi:hypothetical protein